MKIIHHTIGNFFIIYYLLHSWYYHKKIEEKIYCYLLISLYFQAISRGGCLFLFCLTNQAEYGFSTGFILHLRWLHVFIESVYFVSQGRILKVYILYLYDTKRNSNESF